MQEMIRLGWACLITSIILIIWSAVEEFRRQTKLQRKLTEEKDNDRAKKL